VRYSAKHVVLGNGADPIVRPIRGLRELEGLWSTRKAIAMRVMTGSAGLHGCGRLRKTGEELYGGGDQFGVVRGDATVGQHEHVFKADAHVDSGGGAS